MPMGNKHYFADVNLPFHVWMRESTPAGERWVLREAPQAGSHLRDGVDSQAEGARASADKTAASYITCRPQPTFPV